MLLDTIHADKSLLFVGFLKRLKSIAANRPFSCGHARLFMNKNALDIFCFNGIWSENSHFQSLIPFSF